jgi:hypothetical protein
MLNASGSKIRKPREMPKLQNGISKTGLIKSGNSETEERATAHLK